MAYVVVHLVDGQPPTRLHSGQILNEVQDVGTADTATTDQALLDAGTIVLGPPPTAADPLIAESAARTAADSAEATTRANADTAEQARALAAEALLAPKANPAFTGTAAFAASTVKAGGSSSTARVGGTLFTHFTDAPNGTTVETDLYSDSVPASTLAANGDSVAATYGGIIVQSATATRQLKVYFGGSVIFDPGALSVSVAGDWVIEATIMRVSATVVRYAVAMTLTGASLGAYADVGELTGLTLSGANVLKVTGQAAGVGASSSDIVAQVASVGWMPA